MSAAQAVGVRGDLAPFGRECRPDLDVELHPVGALDRAPAARCAGRSSWTAPAGSARGRAPLSLANSLRSPRHGVGGAVESSPDTGARRSRGWSPAEVVLRGRPRAAGPRCLPQSGVAPLSSTSASGLELSGTSAPRESVVSRRERHRVADRPSIPSVIRRFVHGSRDQAAYPAKPACARRVAVLLSLRWPQPRCCTRPARAGALRCLAGRSAALGAERGPRRVPVRPGRGRYDLSGFADAITVLRRG